MKRRPYLISVSVLGAVVAMFVLVMSVTGAASVQAAPMVTDRYVEPGGNDSGECTHDAPCRTVQYALTKASPGDTLIIGGGTYTGTVEIAKWVTMEGGYSAIPNPFSGGKLWLRTSCDPSFTVLDGLRAGRVISIGSGVTVTINCLTIANGDASGPGGDAYGGDAGGGVYAWLPGKVLISNAVITNNTVGPSGYGGGIYVAGGSLVLSRTQVVSNLASLGGGLYLDGALSAVIENSDLVKNHAWNSGGGVRTVSSRNVMIVASTFLTNSASYGGGLEISFGSGAVVTGSTFSGNSVGGSGGGINLWWSGGPHIQNNAIFSNEAVQDGGGIYIYGNTSSPSLISGNTITHNQATRGGGVYLGNSSQKATLFSENRLFANSAAYGGGLYLEDSLSTLRNNFISVNSASYGGGGNGGGIYVDGGTSHMAHNTLARNSSGGWGSGVHVVNGATAWLTNTILVGYPSTNDYASGIYVGSGATATLAATLWGTGSWAYNHDWVGAGTILTGTINIWEEPGFVDPCRNDYHLDQGSAAINAGVDAGVTTDCDGDPRLGAPDLGADEYVVYTYLPLVLKSYP